MKVLVACECSGIVRDAFLALGHVAISCDLQPSDTPGPHYQGNVFDIIDKPWDLIIAHPPCTDIAVCGSKFFEIKRRDGRQQRAIEFFMKFTKLSHARVAIENPICIMSSIWRQPDQIIQPWQFGCGETKATCLWLKGLPTLKPTNILHGKENRKHRIHELWLTTKNEELSKIRSKTYEGIAMAMAEQWGDENALQSYDDLFWNL